MVSHNASITDLGTLSQEHRGSLAMWLFMPVGLFFLLIALFYTYITISSGTWIGLLIVGPLLLLALPFLLVWYRGLKTRVCVFDQGFTYTKGGKTRTIRWDEIEKVWQYGLRYHIYFIPIATIHVYTIQTRDGTRLKLGSGVGKVKHLGEYIQAQVMNIMLPRAIETYNSGGTLEFGRLNLSQAGISNGKEVIAWNQIKNVKVWRGRLRIEKVGKLQWLGWANTIAVARVPNFWLFTTLVDNIRRSRG